MKFGENSLDKMTTIDLFALVPWVFEQLRCLKLCCNAQGAKERTNMRTLKLKKFPENSLDKMKTMALFALVPWVF